MSRLNQDSPSARSYLPAALKLLVPGWLLLGMILVAHFNITLDRESSLILQQQRANSELTRQMMADRLREMTADARILADHVGSVSAGLNSWAALTDYFLRFANHKPAYSQLRFIDASGMEQVRINNNERIEAVAPAQLQNKAARYYFQKSVGLHSGQVYISPFDLNVEQGQVEENNPTLRVASAVYSRGQVLGIVVLNLDGADLFEAVWGNAAIATDAIALVSRNGFSLIRPQAEKNRVSFSDQNPLAENAPQLWERIDGTPKGQLIHSNSFYSFTSLNMDNASGNHAWKIFTILNEQALQRAEDEFVLQNSPFYTLLALMIAVGAVVNSRHQLRHQHVLEHNAYERSFRHLVEEIDLAAISISPEGRVLFCNDHFLDITGYQRSQVLDEIWWERFVATGQKENCQQNLEQGFSEHRSPSPFQGRVITQKGTVITLSWTCSLQLNSDGQTEHMALVGEDITARLAAEKEVRLLKQAVEQSANTVMITDTRGCITYVNPAFCQLSGYAMDEVLGRNPRLLKSGYTTDEQYQKLWQTLKEGGIWQGEFHNRKKNGDIFCERAVISPVRDKRGMTLAFIAVKQDITEEKRLQNELEKETAQRVRNEQLAAVGRMANMVAHDLRNPLSSIKVGLQMTSRKPGLDEGSQELCQISLDQIRHMEGILEDMMAYSRPDDLRREWISVNQVLEQVMLAQLRLIQDRNVFIDQDVDAHLPTVYADPVKLRQAIQNLVINAIQAAEASDNQIARVALKTRLQFTDQGHKVVLEIINNGSTIDPCLRDKVFEPFYTTKAKGTGLGLAIVQRIIQQHHGDVMLDPLTCGGTRARVSLPLMQTDETDEAA